jgi:hypothetical protein
MNGKKKTRKTSTRRGGRKKTKKNKVLKDTRMTLKQFFSWCRNTGRIKPEKEQELTTFLLVDNRLTEKEEKETYLKALAKY